MKKNTIYLLTLVLLTFTLYSFMLSDTFKTMDDEISIIKDERIKDMSNTGEILTTSYFKSDAYYRPLVSLTYMLEYHLFGLNPFYYYLTNIFVHIISAVVLWRIMLIIFGNNSIAFYIALLFAIHPVHWEAVSNISGRAILLSACFVINTFHQFCILVQSKKNKYRRLFFSLFFFLMALLSKESAGVLPAIFICYLYLLYIPKTAKEQTLVSKLKICFIYVLPYAVLEGFYIIFRRSLGITQLFIWRNPKEAVLGFITFLRSVITHCRILLFPVDLQFDRARKLFITFEDPGVWITLFIMLTVLVGIVKYRKRISPYVMFFILWFWIEMIPVSQFLVTIGVQPGYISVAEHFLYSSSIGIFVLIVLGFKYAYDQNTKHNIIHTKIFKIIIITCYTFLYLITVQQNIYSSNEISMFVRTLEFNPNNTRIRYNLAIAYVKHKLYEDAEEQYREILRIAPYEAKAQVGLGKALCDQGKYWECLAAYDRVDTKNIGDMNELLTENIWLTYDLIIDNYLVILSEDKNNPQLLYSLGVIYSRKGSIYKAIDAYEKALELRPDYKNALFNLGSSYEALGRVDDAAIIYNKILALPGEKDDLKKMSEIRLKEINEN